MADEELLSAGKIAEKLGVSPGKVSKYLKEPDQLKGRCGYFGSEKVKAIGQALKAK